MRLYCYHTVSNEDILNEYFLPSIGVEYDLTIRKGSFFGPMINYHEHHWAQLAREKVAVIIEAVRETWGGLFVFSDPDVQFFAPTKELLTDTSSSSDIVMQQANPWGDVCGGFFACKGNSRALKLWEGVLAHIDDEKDDQDTINSLLRNNTPSPTLIRRAYDKSLRKRNTRRSQQGSNGYGVRWKCLPLDKFFIAGARTGEVWEPGMELDVPRSIVMHHASWVVGKENKVAQLEEVREIVRARTRAW
jgi:nucleotide-diphospho-sugar transferase